jgi:glycosyl transferase family 25
MRVKKFHKNTVQFKKSIIIYMVILYLIIYIFFLFSFTNNYNNEYFSNTDPYDKIDVIYYINLDHRTDRNDLFLQEMKNIDFPSNKIKRISAIKHDNGAIGCSSSHILILKDFIDSNYKTCIIFEDDFEFTVSKEEFKNQLSNIFDNNIKFDVVCLSSNVITADDTKYTFIKKIINAQTASGYMLTKQYAKDYLIDNFIIGKYLLENNQHLYHKYAIDQYWKLLQPNHDWYLFNPKIGIQRESYSDIIKGVVNYEVFTNII